MQKKESNEKMSKESEAFNEIEHELRQRHLDMYADNHDKEFMDILTDSMDKRFNLVRKALTPPTQEEVCKALSEYVYEHNLIGVTEVKIKYENNSFIATDEEDEETIIVQDFYGELDFCFPLSTKLTKLVCSFYEGLESEKE